MNVTIKAEVGKQDIWIERVFHVAPNLVYSMFTDAWLICQWQGDNCTFKSFECQNGGIYESEHKGVDGNTYGFKGVYHELIPDERIIRTSEFLGLPFKVIPTLEIYSFEKVDEEKTKLTIQIICNNEEVRDAMVQHGMEAKFDAIFKSIDKLLG